MRTQSMATADVGDPSVPVPQPLDGSLSPSMALCHMRLILPQPRPLHPQPRPPSSAAARLLPTLT